MRKVQSQQSVPVRSIIIKDETGSGKVSLPLARTVGIGASANRQLYKINQYEYWVLQGAIFQ